MNWNPLYVSYANSRGRTPEEMLKVDDVSFPGGSMCGYLIWISQAWQAWDRIFNPRQAHHSENDREDFTKWLQFNYATIDPEEKPDESLPF